MPRQSLSVAEIAPGIYRIATYHEPWRCSVNQFLVTGDEPALVSTGLRGGFEDTWAGISEVLDPTTLHIIVIPHFESDECGALNEFLSRAPQATPFASSRAVVSSLADFAVRPPQALGDGQVMTTGTHHLRVIEFPYVHAWDGIVVADEKARIAFTSDLFMQPGFCEPVSCDDRSAISVQLYRTFYGSPPEPYLQRAIDRIEALAPAIIAPGHGSALSGNLAQYFRALRAAAGAEWRPAHLGAEAIHPAR